MYIKKKTYCIMTQETFERTDSGKSWKSKPESVEVKQLERQHFENMTCDGTCQWFRRAGGSEYQERSYTSKGYVVTRLISCDPCRSIRKVRTFKFI